MEKEHKARPIIFQGWGVRAIMEGRKTETRRVVIPQPTVHPGMNCERLRFYDRKGRLKVDVAIGDPNSASGCPYGYPGEQLYVRETWGDLTADHPKCKDGRKPSPGDRLVYRANPADAAQWIPGHPGCADFCWRPSIHMPRWASRLMLEITEVRIQMLQDISEEDAKAEGVERKLLYDPANPDTVADSYRMTFADLWDDINGKKFPWSSNYWVWAISFRRI